MGVIHQARCTPTKKQVMLLPKSEKEYTSAGSASYSNPPKSTYCFPAKADSVGVM